MLNFFEAGPHTIKLVTASTDAVVEWIRDEVKRMEHNKLVKKGFWRCAEYPTEQLSSPLDSFVDDRAETSRWNPQIRVSDLGSNIPITLLEINDTRTRILPYGRMARDLAASIVHLDWQLGGDSYFNLSVTTYPNRIRYFSADYSQGELNIEESGDPYPWEIHEFAQHFRSEEMKAKLAEMLRKLGMCFDDRLGVKASRSYLFSGQ